MEETGRNTIEQIRSIPASGPPPDALLMKMLFGPLMQQCICVAAKLKISDLLAERPQTIAELAAKTNTNEGALYRVLRMLSSSRIYTENKDHKFELTPMAALLRSDVPNSMYSFVIMMGDDWQWRAWGELMYSVKTGKTAYSKLYGMGAFEFRAANPEAGIVFNNAMTNLSKTVVRPIVDAYNFSGVGKVADIAGGHGMLLAGVLKANPQVEGILFDLPHVIEGASTLLTKEGIFNRVEVISGDFFESVPVGANIYILKLIIHDWDDTLSIKILKNIRSAMNDNSKVLLIEMIVPESNDPSPAKMTDLQMLVIEGGKERTAGEYMSLLESAGFKLTRIIPTHSPYSLIEARRM